MKPEIPIWETALSGDELGVNHNKAGEDSGTHSGTHDQQLPPGQTGVIGGVKRMGRDSI